MGYHSMSADEWRHFLRAPVRPAVVATVRADGRPHTVPVWYELDGDDVVVFTTGDKTVKGHNLARNPKMALCVQDDQPPFSFVSIEGTVELSDDLDAVREWATRIGGRYMGSDRAAEFGDRNAVPGELLVRVRIDKVTAVRDVAD